MRKKQRPIRAWDEVRVDGTGQVWQVLEVENGKANLMSKRAYPPVGWRGVDVDRLTLFQDIA